MKNCRLKRDYFKNNLGTYFHGFKLMASGVSLAFYAKTEDEREQWVAKLAPSVISVELREEFSVQSQPLGRGSQATVYLCHRKESKEASFALKCFRKADLASDQLKQKDMLHEIDILRSISHESIIQIHGVFETRHHVGLLLPYLQGGALFEQMQQKSVL